MPDAERRAERLGVLGGTFDPPHCGHVVVARSCVEQLGLDRLLLVVANHPWMKVPTRTVSPAADRLAMVEAATAGLDRVTASRIEIDRGGPSYTVETVEALALQARQRGVPAPEVFMIVGADLVPQLASWHRPDDLRRAVTLVVVPRPRTPRPAVPPGWRAVEVACPEVDVSSSAVRARVAQGRPLDGLVPAAVVRIIGQRSLYAVDG